MSILNYEKLNSNEKICIDSGVSSINSMIETSYYPCVLQHAYTYKVFLEEILVGCYMIKFLKLNLDDLPDEISEHRSSICDECVAIQIKYIAVDKKYQRNGIGVAIMKKIIFDVMKLSQSWPVRMISLDALNEKVEWYKKIGFRPYDMNYKKNRGHTTFMYLDCIIDINAVIKYEEQYTQNNI